MTAHFVIVLLLLFAFNAKATDLESSETQSTGRGASSVKNLNSIPLTIQKSQDSPYYPQQQPIQQYYPLQYVQNAIPYQQPQHQPPMIVIAQPAQVQQHLLTTAAQQLLQYFHGNPQARVQFLQGNFIPNIAHVQPQPQPQYVQQPLPYYHLTAVQQPQYQQYQPAQTPIQAHPVSPQIHSQTAASYNVPQTTTTGSQDYNSFPFTGQFGHSTSLNHITALAQLAAQKYVPNLNYRSNPPAIITGLENFTPEQQAQIKAQLNSGQPITPLKSSTPLNTSALQQLYSTQAGGKVQDNLSQDQYQSSNANDDPKATNQNYQNNNSNSNTNANNNSNNYNGFGTKG